MITTNNPFHMRSFRHAGTAGQDRFTATLALNRFVVAKVSGVTGEHACVDVDAINAHYWKEFESFAAHSISPDRFEDADASPAAMMLMDMADQAYHARRLQVTSLRHAAFRLHGDAPGVFRYLRGRAYSPEVEGELRLTFGRRLEAVFRRGEGMLQMAAAGG